MGIEGMEQLNKDIERERRRKDVMMQAKLARDKYPQLNENEAILTWVEYNHQKYSRLFRKFLNKEIKSNPNFWEDFKNPNYEVDFMRRVAEYLYADDHDEDNKEEPLQMAA